MALRAEGCSHAGHPTMSAPDVIESDDRGNCTKDWWFSGYSRVTGDQFSFVVALVDGSVFRGSELIRSYISKTPKTAMLLLTSIAATVLLSRIHRLYRLLSEPSKMAYPV
jgi:hypothetical protein